MILRALYCLAMIADVGVISMSVMTAKGQGDIPGLREATET